MKARKEKEDRRMPLSAADPGGLHQIPRLEIARSQSKPESPPQFLLFRGFILSCFRDSPDAFKQREQCTGDTYFADTVAKCRSCVSTRH